MLRINESRTLIGALSKIINMRKIILSFIVISLTFAIACKNETMKSTDAKTPSAEKQPVHLEKHGDLRIDNYFWMRLSDEQKKCNR